MVHLSILRLTTESSRLFTCLSYNTSSISYCTFVLQINLVPVFGQEGDNLTVALGLIYDNQDHPADFYCPNLPWTLAV
jgi:hypothetical protein